MSYLDLLPTDLIKEICTYLNTKEMKYVLQIRGFVDVDLLTELFNKSSHAVCKLCLRHCSKRDMNVGLNGRYCTYCINSNKFCQTCKGIVPKDDSDYDENECEKCKTMYCTKHKQNTKYKCVICMKIFCHLHCYLYNDRIYCQYCYAML